MRKPSAGFPTGSDTNWAIQPHESVRSLRVLDLGRPVEGLCYAVKTKVQRGNWASDLSFRFLHNVMILNFWTDRSGQTVQTLIRLLL